MIRTQQLGLKGLGMIMTIMFGCNTSGHVTSYSKIIKSEKPNFYKTFALYCNPSREMSDEELSVLASFVGQNVDALNFADADAVAVAKRRPRSGDVLSSLDLNNKITVDPAMDSLLKKFRQSPEEIFRDKVKENAVDYIVKQSNKYHFLLINEAHNRPQNRAFTLELLKPLWVKGYRYLALEALDYQDSTLMERGYAVRHTGYYTEEPTFGRLVREAIALGYTLIPYEAQKDFHASSTTRDGKQAQNIYDATYKKDKIGKVIIHAGYSHIIEAGDSLNMPMGYQLKTLFGHDVFTIDQVDMMEFGDQELLNTYYRYVIQHYTFLNAVVFLNKDHSSFVQPFYMGGIDVQVFHPKTRYRNGRPEWLYYEGYHAYILPRKILKYQGALIQAIPYGNDKDTVPVDQFVIAEGKALVLRKGRYLLRIINSEGTLIASLVLNAGDTGSKA